MSPDLPQLGEVLAGRFEIGERLGDGGMAVVMRALDRTTSRPVALKLLTPRYLGRPEREQRLLDEAAYLGALRGSPNIIGLVDHGRIAGPHDWPYLATELLAGRALHWLLIDRRFTQGEIHTLATQLAHALAACHARGIVHRDLTPANVFVDEATMQVTLFDFSHAGSSASPRVAAGASGRLTGAHDIPGTDGYMSPEQAMAAPAIEAMDVFAFGVVVYELITGRNPFPASDRSHFIQGQRSGALKVPRLDAWAYRLPEGWADLIEACTAREASARPTIERVQAWLSELAGVTATAVEPSPPAIGLRPSSWPAPSAHPPAVAAIETTERLRETEVRRRQAAHADRAAPDASLDAQPTLVFARPNAPPVELPEVPTEDGVDEPPDEAPTPQPRSRARPNMFGGLVLFFVVVVMGLAWQWWPDGSDSRSEAASAEPSSERRAPEHHSESITAAPPRPDADEGVRETDAVEPSATTSDGVDGTGPAVASETGAPSEPPAETGPASTTATAPVESAPRDGCEGVEAAGRKALDELEWDAVIRLTAKKRCWSSRDERVRLRVEALMQARRWAECVEAAEGSADPKVTRWANFCGKHL